MRYLWQYNEGVKSLAAYEHLKTFVDNTLHKSRASVIFFLDDMTVDGFLVKDHKTGKGGSHGIWKPSPNFPCEEAYINEMAMKMVKAAGNILNVTFVPKQNPVN